MHSQVIEEVPPPPEFGAAPIRTWTGANGANWNVPGNWTSPAVPDGTTDVNINNGGGPLINSAQTVRLMKVGETGTGLLTIDGGVLTSTNAAVIGALAGSNGTVTITGAGSAWTAASAFSLQVGGLGTGTLNILNGGNLTNTGSGILTVGSQAGSVGTVLVDAGSLTVSQLQVGGLGQGTLTVQNAGTVTSGVSSIGLGTAASPLSTATVTGAGSSWTTSSLTIGNKSDGRLDLTAGASMTSNSVAIASTDARLASNGTGLVTVDAATWTVNGNMSVGGVKDGTLNILNGSVVTIGDRLVSGSGNGIGRVTVDNSTLTVGGDTVEVGGGAGSGAGAGFMTIRNGSTANFNVNVLNISGRANSVPGALLVEGAGTTLNVTGTVSISNNIPGSLTVRDNAVMTSGALGAGGGSGNAVMVVDTNATWNINGGARLARSTGTASLLIQNGGAVNATGEMEVGLNGTGTVTIGGTGGTLTATALIGGGRDINGNLLPANGTATLNFTHTNAGLAFAPPVIGGPITVNHSGTGTTIMNGDSTHTGFVNITGGVMRGGIVNSFSENAAYTVAGGTLELNNLNNEVGSLQGTTNVTLGTGTLTTGRLNTSTSYSGVISGTGGLIKTGAGTFTLNSAQTYTGATSLLQGKLQAGVADVIAPSSGLTVAANTIFDTGRFDQSLGQAAGTGVFNAGLIEMTSGASAPGSILRVLGNYTGQGGGIGMKTFLGEDGSPSDRVVIDGGAASGATALRIDRAGGNGAKTTGNGILVVDAINGGTTAAGAFSLARPVVAGPFEYDLLRGSADASNANAWYLRSPGIPRPETSNYAVIPALGILYGGKLLDTLDERWGSWKRDADLDGRTAGYEKTMVASSVGNAAPQRRFADGAWGRYVYQHGKREGASAGIFDVGPTYQYDFQALQAGMDLLHLEHADGRSSHTGIYGAYGYSKGRITHFDGRDGGENGFTALTAGGYWTLIGASNWYVDTILQYTHYDARGNGNRGLPDLKTKGHAWAASLEGGYPFRMGGGWVIEPQAQLVYAVFKLNNAEDAGGPIDFSNITTNVARLGARIARSWRGDRGPITAWTRLSALHQSGDGPQANFAGPGTTFPFTSSMGGSWWEAKLGLNADVRKDSSVFGAVGYQRGFDGDRYAYDLKLGFRAEW